MSIDAKETSSNDGLTSQKSPTSAAEADYGTGVSNGDVDWLFRGKASKKLAKKKSEVGNLTFNKQIVNGNGKPLLEKQPLPQEPKSKLSEQLLLEKQRHEPNKPLKSAIVNIGNPEPAETRNRSLSDSNKLLANRAMQDLKLAANNLQRRSSEATVSIPSQQSASLNTTAPNTLPGKKNILSSISSKFAKPSSSNSSPIATSPLQQTTSNNSTVGAFNINQSASKKQLVLQQQQVHTNLAVTPPEQKGLFGIRRRLSVTKNTTSLSAKASPQTQPRKSVDHGQVPVKLSLPVLSLLQPQKKPAVDLLATTKLKRVTFALDKLKDDPQQQIPSRNPKRGNVLVPEDILAEPARLSIGIADSSNTVLGPKKQQSHDLELLQLAYQTQKAALLESQKHAQEAHIAAQRMAKEVSSFKFSKSSKTKEEVADEEDLNFVHTPAHMHNIDNPLHHHIDYFGGDTSTESTELNDLDDDEDDEDREIPLDVVYTRCCHLREILPIPATLKQLKHKTKPLTVLKMLNPKPTLIDILSFADFLAITPIMTIIFDNVTIDAEMLKIVLASIANSVFLEKLSLRNVAIDSEGWLYLCKFLTQSKSLIKLDISQQKIKAETPKNMHRSEMDWALFNESLLRKGGIEELVINGCKLNDYQFQRLIESGVSLSTKRLGVASTNLNLKKAEVLLKWITKENSTCIGVDIAFNDVSNGQLRPFIENLKESTKLVFFSLNSTKVPVRDCEDMIKTLSYVKSLRFLDLSNIPHCFPAIISTLAEWLPKFQDLRRIHFELDELTAPELVAISNILPNCKNLIHVSFLGHKDINYATAVALYGALKLSSIYTLDIDYDLIPEDLTSKIALYLMINMEKSMNKDLHFEYERSDEELMYDGSLITQAVEKMLENKQTPTEPSVKKSEEVYSKEIITNALVEKTSRVRKDIHKQMDKLFDLRMRGELSLEGKETLIRFCLLDSSLEKVVHIFEEEEENKKNPLANVPSITTEDEHMHKVSSDILESGPIVSPNLPMNNHQTSYFSPLQPLNPVTSEHPHMVVADSNKEGEDIPVDQSTGRPVLFRKLSHTSEHAKQQEEEEGEFHKWGFFMQQQDSLFSTSIDQKMNPSSLNSSKPPSSAQTEASLPLSQHELHTAPIHSLPLLLKAPQTATQPAVPKKLNILPSGPELRELIIKSKGLQKVNDLIDKFNIDHNRNIQIEDLYNTLAIGKSLQEQQSQTTSPLLQSQLNQQLIDDYQALDKLGEKGINITSPVSLHPFDNIESGSPRSINSLELDEAYDKLLNEVDRVRSNKA